MGALGRGPCQLYYVYGQALGLLPVVNSGSGWVPGRGLGEAASMGGIRGEQEGGERWGREKDRENI